MRQTKPVSWVVYETPATAKMAAMQVVCEDAEWAKLRADAGYRLVKAGIPSEAEADRIARDATAGLARSPRAYR
jgi:hypothetical protein